MSNDTTPTTDQTPDQPENTEAVSPESDGSTDTPTTPDQPAERPETPGLVTDTDEVVTEAPAEVIETIDTPVEDDKDTEKVAEPAAAPTADTAAPSEAPAEKPSTTPTDSAPKPPHPAPPGKRPGHHAPRPGGPSMKPKAPTAPLAPAVDPKLADEAKTFGRVDDEGRVFILAQGDYPEREVGQFAADGSKDDALDMYVRRYLDLVAQVSLLESRIDTVNPNELTSGMKHLDEALVEPAVVGNIVALHQRHAALKTRLDERKTEFEAERKAAKEAALAKRTEIIERAEAIAAQDPDKTHWRDSRTELNDLLEQWKNSQRNDTRIDRKSEEALWKRFSRARTAFDRHRRHHFSKVEAERSEVTSKKEALILRAQEMSASTDWSATSAAYRDLLEEWKRAGRTTRREDDKLWARFRVAQQTFFDNRQAHYDSIDSEQSENLKAKLALVEEAEALLPVGNIREAKDKLHDIQDRWEEIGFVPRKDMARTEGKLRQVESAIRAAEDDQWRKSDPTKKERATGFAAQLEDAIAKHTEELEAAKAAGDAEGVKRAEEALQARQAWLNQLKK